MRRISREPSPTGTLGSQLDAPLVNPTSVTAQPSLARWRAKSIAYCPTAKVRRQPVTKIDQSLRHLIAIYCLTRFQSSFDQISYEQARDNNEDVHSNEAAAET